MSDTRFATTGTSWWEAETENHRLGGRLRLLGRTLSADALFSFMSFLRTRKCVWTFNKSLSLSPSLSLSVSVSLSLSLSVSLSVSVSLSLSPPSLSPLLSLPPSPPSLSPSVSLSPLSLSPPLSPPSPSLSPPSLSPPLSLPLSLSPLSLSPPLSLLPLGVSWSHRPVRLACHVGLTTFANCSN